MTEKQESGPHKDGFGIVNYNPRRTYCPLVQKLYTFNATKGSPQSVKWGSIYYFPLRFRSNYLHELASTDRSYKGLQMASM